MTKLNKPVSRETTKTISGRNVIVTVAPCGGSQTEARIAFRLKGRRTQYVMLLSDLYRIAALQYGQKEKSAKREARKNGIPWKQAKRKFNSENSI